MDGPAVTAPQDRELDAATINVCVGLLMEEASRLDASAWSMHSTGAFEAAAREQDECALRFRRMARELSALRPAPAVEKPTPTYAGYSIVADENWLGPGMIGVKQPAPAAPEGERVSWYSCSTCKGLHAHGEACPLIERPVSPASSKGEKPMSDEEIGNHLIERMSGLNVAWAHDYQARDVGHFARELLSRDLDVELIVERNGLAQENAKLREERDALRLDFERGCPGPDRIMHVAVTDALGLDPVNGSLELVEALKWFREERIQTVRVKSREMADEARIAGLSQAVDRLENERDALKWRLHEAEHLLPAQPERTP